MNMKNRKGPFGVAAALALCLPAFSFAAPSGQAERMHAEASWMDGVGKSQGSAAVLAGAAAGRLDHGLARPSLKPPSGRSGVASGGYGESAAPRTMAALERFGEAYNYVMSPVSMDNVGPEGSVILWTFVPVAWVLLPFAVIAGLGAMIIG